MKNDLREIVLPDQFGKEPVHVGGFDRPSVRGSKYKTVIHIVLTEQFLDLFLILLVQDKHLRHSLRKENLPYAGFGLRLFQHQCRVRAADCGWKPANNTLISKSFHGHPIDTLQLFVDKNISLSVFNTGLGDINTIPCQPEQLAHPERAGKGQVHSELKIVIFT